VTLNGSPSVYSTETTSNRLTGITNPARSFGYDPAGNTTSDSTNYTATYDASGRLQTLTKAGTTTTYSYNGLGQRVRKFSSSGASSTTIFVYDQQGQLLGEYSNTGAALREYVWLGNTPIAMFTPPASGSTPVVYYFHTDHLNTPRVVTDTANNVRWRWIAEPFGTTAPETNPAGLGVFIQNLRFPGQVYDIESNLHYNYFRDYDPSTGRYVQSDPIGLRGGISTYGYVEASPLSMIDPEGLAACYVNFPDYPITIPYLGIKADLGHAGVLGYDNATGATRYFEYGRYAPNGQGAVGDQRPEKEGNVRRQRVDDLVIDPKTGAPTPESLDALRKQLSRDLGRGTRAELTCDSKADEKKVYDFVDQFAKDKKRPSYSWVPQNHCKSFARSALRAGQ
jgi:RHS repeat-associated protein